MIMFIVLPTICYSQDTSGIINPGATFTNDGQESVYYLSEDKISRLLNIQDSARILSKNNMIYAELLEKTEEMLQLSEQLTEEKQKEILYWKEELSNNEKARRKWWFLGGVVLGVILGR